MPGINQRRPRSLKAGWLKKVPDFVRSISLSPDAQWIACGDASGTVSIVSAASGDIRAQWSVSTQPISNLLWSKTDQLIYASGNSVTIADPGNEAKREFRTIDTNAFWIEDLTLSACGERFALCADKTAQVYRLDGTCIFETPPQESTVAGAAFLDAQRLATSCYGRVGIWDIGDGREQRHFSWKGSLFRPHPSPDGSVIACGCQDSSVHFWRMKSGQDSRMMGYPGKPRFLDWNKDSTLLATAASDTLLVWNFHGSGPEGTTPMVMEGHGRPISAMTFHPSMDLVLSGDEQGMILIWGPEKGEIPVALAALHGEVSALAWLPEGNLFIAGDGDGNLARFSST